MKKSKIMNLKRDLKTLRAWRCQTFKLQFKRFVLAWKIIGKGLYLYRFLLISLLLTAATIFVAIPNLGWLVLNSIVHFPHWEETIYVRTIIAVCIVSLDCLFYMARTSAIEKKEKALKKRRQQC